MRGSTVHNHTPVYIVFTQCLLVAASREQLTEVEYKRATHAVTEIERSIQSRDILKQGKYREFGQLMTKSHYSLRYKNHGNLLIPEIISHSLLN